MTETVSFENLVPRRKIGNGTNGVVILTKDKKFCVKIYKKIVGRGLQKILQILQNEENHLDTIYKTYMLHVDKNNIRRYNQEQLPKKFGISGLENSTEIENLYKTYNLKNKVFEVMKKYQMTLEDFFTVLRHTTQIGLEQKKIIIKSFIKQGLITLFSLYINHGIVHNDIHSQNFFVEETDEDFFVTPIKGIKYGVDTARYSLIIADFGISRSLEVVKYAENRSLSGWNISPDFNPFNDIFNMIGMFESISKELFDMNTDMYLEEIVGITRDIFDIDIESTNYHTMIQTYIRGNPLFELELLKFKNYYFERINHDVLRSVVFLSIK
jgi:serine/threonine protein kinase